MLMLLRVGDISFPSPIEFTKSAPYLKTTNKVILHQVMTRFAHCLSINKPSCYEKYLKLIAGQAFPTNKQIVFYAEVRTYPPRDRYTHGIYQSRKLPTMAYLEGNLEYYPIH